LFVAVVWRWCGGGVAVVRRWCGDGVAMVWRWHGGDVAVVWRSRGDIQKRKPVVMLGQTPVNHK